MVGEAVEHPAKFSAAVLEELRLTLKAYAPEGGEILDPFAGVGRIHQLAQYGYETVGVELEPEWAAEHADTIVGDATKLPARWSGRFDIVATSPPYANRMADAYGGDARGSRRHTYRIALGRPLTDGSAAALQWGHAYRETMRKAFSEVHRVLKPSGLFLLNVSDHVRAGELQGVPDWMRFCLERRGLFDYLEETPIRTPRNRHGANGDLRADAEVLLIYRRRP